MLELTDGLVEPLDVFEPSSGNALSTDELIIFEGAVLAVGVFNGGVDVLSSGGEIDCDDVDENEDDEDDIDRVLVGCG